MIRYALVCTAGHSFESWFRDSGAFDTLVSSDQLACPVCGTAEVRKAMMAPSVLTSRRKRPLAPAVAETLAGAPADPGQSSEQRQGIQAPARPATLLNDRERHLRTMLRALHKEIIEKADDVGRAFAEEARRIHEGDAAPRSIYGEASREEVDALLEDGVPLLPMPVPPGDHN